MIPRQPRESIVDTDFSSSIAAVYEFETPREVDPFWSKVAEALADLLGRQLAAVERRKKAKSTRAREGPFLVPPQAAENNGPEIWLRPA